MSELKPFLKWPGGKRQLLPEIRKYYPKQFNTYYELFLGGGAVLFDLQPKKAVINDLNSDVYNLYQVIKNNPVELINTLEKYKNTEENYYKIRNWDRTSDWQLKYTPIEIAARMLYLNRTCFNGLYRINSKGQFNSPYGHYRSVSFSNLLEVSNFFNNFDIKIMNSDFEQIIKNADKNDFIYQDPPYDPISETSNFTSYTKEGFNKDDQVRLCNWFKELSYRGCYCLLSNSNTEFIRDLYKDFDIIEVQAKRSINCNGDKRGKIGELLIKNY